MFLQHCRNFSSFRSIIFRHSPEVFHPEDAQQRMEKKLGVDSLPYSRELENQILDDQIASLRRQLSEGDGHNHSNYLPDYGQMDKETAESLLNELSKVRNTKNRPTNGMLLAQVQHALDLDRKYGEKVDQVQRQIDEARKIPNEVDMRLEIKKLDQEYDSLERSWEYLIREYVTGKFGDYAVILTLRIDQMHTTFENIGEKIPRPWDNDWMSGHQHVPHFQTLFRFQELVKQYVQIKTETEKKKQ